MSKEDHCLADLLHRWRSGELECDIPCVISNHEDLRSFVEWHGIPFHYVPVPAEPATEGGGVRRDRQPVRGERADVMVLARYMQIVPPVAVRASTAAASSTSTTASCPPSPAPAPTTRPSPGASS